MVGESRKTLLDKLRGAKTALNTGLAAAGLAFLSGCATFQTKSPEPEITHRAGSVYLVDNIGFAEEDELERILHYTQKSFEEVGIGFEDFEITTREKIPEMEDLDVVVYFTHSEDKNDHGIFLYVPQDSLPEEFSVEPFYWKGDQVAYVFPENKIRDYLEDCECDPSQEKKNWIIANTVIHEVGHSLGASHVGYEIKCEEDKVHLYLEEGVYLGQNEGKTKPSFHPQNVKKMKNFISKAKELQKRGYTADFERHGFILDNVVLNPD